MNQDFSQLCILPPFNNLHAQVIDRRGEEPRIASSGISVLYSIPGNTTSITKTEFLELCTGTIRCAPTTESLA